MSHSSLDRPVGIVVIVVVAAALINWCCASADRWVRTDIIDPCKKGSPRLNVTSHWDNGEVSAVGKLCGDLSTLWRDKQGHTIRGVDFMWLCPGVSWACSDINGFDAIVRRTHVYAESQCNETQPIRVYEMPPTKAHEMCRVRLQIEPSHHAVLIGTGPEPLSWANNR